MRVHVKGETRSAYCDRKRNEPGYLWASIFPDSATKCFRIETNSEIDVKSIEGLCSFGISLTLQTVKSIPSQPVLDNLSQSKPSYIDKSLTEDFMHWSL